MSTIVKQQAAGPAISSLARVSRARSFVHHSGLVWVHCDHEAFEYFADVTIGASARYREEVIAQMKAWGLEPDLEMTEFIAEGVKRLIFSPIIPLSDEEIAWLAGEEEVVA